VIGPDGVPIIDQDNLEFRPGSLTVPVGQTVRFLNSESALHTVTVDGDNLSGNMQRSDAFEWTPEEAGTYRITCEYHGNMRATITVEEPPQ
jgi:plastocyanin